MHRAQADEPNFQRAISNQSQPDVQHDNENLCQPHPSSAPQDNHALQREEDGFINERPVRGGEADRRVAEKRVDVRGEQLLAEGRVGQEGGEQQLQTVMHF